MNSDLLRYYNEELRFLRQQGREFANQHPQIAARLTLDEDGAETVRDPHVERLIQAVALLNARTRLKLDDDFPEVTEALLNLTAPHYTSPVPPMAIAECRLPETQGGMIQGVHLPREAPLESAALPDGEPLRFRTVYPISAWPFAVADAAIEHQPFAAPEGPMSRSAAAVIRIRLKTFSPEVSLSQMPAPPLRFFLNTQPPFNYDLYELLFNDVKGLTVAAPAAKTAVQLTPKATILPVGFERSEAALPLAARTPPGHILLTEFFSFPLKFLFFDVAIPPHVWSTLGSEAELLFYLGREVTQLVPSVTKDTFRLGCTPVVNLYSQTAEPIRINHATSSYRIVPDARRPRVHEIHGIERVTATGSNGRAREFYPFYSFRRDQERGANPCFWLSNRAIPDDAPANADVGSDVHLSLVDLDFRPATPEEATLKVETICMTRDAQRMRHFEDGLPRLQPRAQEAALLRIQCITRPTPVLRPVIGRGTRWRLLSNLSLNGLSLQDLDAGADGLREILRLYNLREDKRSTEMIAGLAGVRFDRATGRVAEQVNGRRQEFICRGHHVTLEFDETRYTAGGLYLFASVLDRFLGAYCSVNSFVQTTAATRQRGNLARWPRRAGDQFVL